MERKNKLKINWIPLQDYYEQWSLVGNNSAYRIAEQIGSIDYLINVKENLPDYELIKKFHERIILISLGALFEYGLKYISQLSLCKDKERSIHPTL